MPVIYLGPICQFLDISADYILGLIDEPIPLKDKQKLTN